MTLKNSLFRTVSALAFIVAAAPVAAQSNDTTLQNDTNASQTSATDLAGGRVVVEQEDATVDVTVPEPDVDVLQGQPLVSVGQGQPEITVNVAEPNVRVQQQAPIVTVEQAQPQISVRIPEPVVTVRVPKPQVDVETGEPIVDLQTPEPVVRFVRPEPKITIEEAEPRVTVERAEPNIDVDGTQDARVNVDQAEADVNVQQADGANVSLQEPQNDPQVNITQADDPQIEIDRAQARVVMEEFNADGQGHMAESDRQRYQELVSELPLFEMRTADIVGRELVTEYGEAVGEIDNVGQRGHMLVAIIGVGGFLGMGETDVAVPVDKLILRNGEIVMPGITEARLEDKPEYDSDEVRLIQANQRLSDSVRMTE